jgi:GTPase SAR1 family protein
LGSIMELARNCFYFITDDCPDELAKMKTPLGEKEHLEAIADLLNDLNKIYHELDEERSKTSRIHYTSLSRKSLFELTAEFIKFRNDDAHMKRLREIIEDKYETLNLTLDVWEQAFNQVLQILSPILVNTFRYSAVDKVDTTGMISHDDKSNMNFIKKVVTYANGKFSTEEERISHEEFEMKPISNEILMNYKGKYIFLDITPFLLIRNNTLYHYKRTKASSYQYLSVSDESVEKISTKKKFSHSVFRSLEMGDQQAIFWTEVIPTLNKTETIKANIPIEYRSVFIGRKTQIRKLREEIIEIPNRDGAIYGPGGVGKTALMIELSKQLFNESNPENIIFNNIIWCSAKATYYNPVYDLTEKKLKQFESLDNILSVILKFFEYEDVDDYNFEDKKELVLSQLEEDSVLLILDNLESLTKEERDKLIRFIVVDAKKHLRNKPNNFKVITTSREMIPSSFHQIKLNGLSLSESRQLMRKLYEPYKNSSNPALTEGQMERLHEVTYGIPLVIIHAFGQLYEHNRPLESLISNLSSASNEVIKFSYEEIFRLLKTEEITKEIFMLLEIYNTPISSRQTADILNVDEKKIQSKLQQLLNFQCIERINEGDQEKFIVNDAVSLLTKALVQADNVLKERIRHKIIENYPIEKRMDYSKEELNLLNIFNNYLRNREFTNAEVFLHEQMDKYRDSILLQYHYAKYLKEQRNEVDRAIPILEKLYELEKKKVIMDPNIIMLLASCYCSLPNPQYHKASKLYEEIDISFEKDQKLLRTVGAFYIKWSTSMNSKKELDPNDELIRKAKVKELAEIGIKKLNSIKKDKLTHNDYFILSQGYSNSCETLKAIETINHAIKLVTGHHVYVNHYLNYKKELSRHI